MAYYTDGESSDQVGPLTSATSMSRQRRVPSSSSTTASSTAPLNDSSDKYRMGIPGALLPLPLEDSPIQTPDEFSKLWIRVCQKVIDLLRKRSIDSHTVSLLHRSLPTRPQAETKTILIFATAGTHPEPWMFFLEFCYEIMVYGLKAKNLKIEIIDPRVLDGKAIFPVTIDDPIFGKWPFLRRRIHQ